MAANEKFILEFVTKGVQDVDRARDKIDGVSKAVSGLATTLLGVSFAGFIAGALQAADRISDFSDATNISIASLKALEAAMNSAGGNGKNLERSISQLYAAIETANGGSLAARDAFAKVGVSLSDLKNMSEADILQKTLQGLAQLPAGAERSAIATQLLSKSFRSVDPAKLLEALDPAKYAASEEATKKAADAQQRLEESYKALQEGAINALEPIVKLMGETSLNAASATKIVQGLGIAFGVLFGAQAIASIGAAVGMIVKLNTALKGTAAAQAFVTALGGPKGLAMVAGSTAAAAAAIYGLNKMLEDTESKGAAAQDAVAGVAAAAGIPSTPGRIQPATPQAGAAGRNQELDARQRAVLESEKRIADASANVRKEQALRTASDLQKIDIDAELTLQKAKQEIYSKENLSKAQKDREYAAVAKAINEKSTSDFIALQKQQQQQVEQVRIGYQDQISQMLGYEKSELQKINEQIAQQPEKYKEIADQLRANAEQHDNTLRIIKEINKEQGRANELFKDGYNIGVDYAKSREMILLDEEKLIRLGKARNEAERQAVTEDIDRRKRLSEINARLLQDEKLAKAIISDQEGDATSEQIQMILDYMDKLQLLKGLEEEISQARINSAARVREQQESFVYGWEEAFNKYVESAYDSAEQARNLFSTFTRGMEDAIVNFVKTGKLSFKDLANTILEQVIRIQVQRATASMFGGGSGGGLLGGIFSGIGKIFGFANGGEPPVGRPSLVGEQGPELFIPRSAGTIIPNNQLAMAGAGGSTTQVTYNIQAVDAASFKSLVSRDPQFLFQVSEKGRRSQPTRSR